MLQVTNNIMSLHTVMKIDKPSTNLSSLFSAETKSCRFLLIVLFLMAGTELTSETNFFLDVKLTEQTAFPCWLYIWCQSTQISQYKLLNCVFQVICKLSTNRQGLMCYLSWCIRNGFRIKQGAWKYYFSMASSNRTSQI